MHDIDFLPAEYRQKHAQRHAQPWRVVVVASFALVIAASAAAQHRRRSQLEERLAEILPQYDAVVASNEDLGKLHVQLQQTRAEAELYAYLGHRWPTTQILDALLAPLPDEITFQRLEIRPESPAGRPAGGPTSREDREAEAQRLATLPPAALDLEELRGRCDGKETLVTISGLTDDSGALHRYLGDLARQELFSKAELDTIESDAAAGETPPRLRFRATLVVRPGYGQPGGPTAETPPAHGAINHPTT